MTTLTRNNSKTAKAHEHTWSASDSLHSAGGSDKVALEQLRVEFDEWVHDCRRVCSQFPDMSRGRVATV